MRDLQVAPAQDPELVEAVVLASMELAMADRAWEALRSEVVRAQSRVPDVWDAYDEARQRFPYAPTLEKLLGNVSLMSLPGSKGAALRRRAVRARPPERPRLLST